MSRNIVVLLTACALFVGLACAGAAPAAEPYKVGAIFAVTGPASWLGEPERDTALMIADQVNKGGGINGHPLELIIEDDQGVEDKAVLAAKKLIGKDEVLAIVGPSTTGPSMALVPVAEKEKVPLVSSAAALSIVSPVKERYWVFKTAQSDAHAAQRIFEYMKGKGITRVAVITISNAFGEGGRKELTAAAPSYGITVVADERYAPADTDMTAQLTKIKGTDAQAVINWSVGPTQVIVTKNVFQLGLKIPLYQSHGWGNLKNIEQAGQAAEGVVAPLGKLMVVDTLADDHVQKKVLATYKTEYETRFKKDVSTFGGHAWDGLMLVIDALRAAGPDRGKIRDYLENKKDFVGISGVFNMSPEEHNGLTKDAFEMTVVKDGRFVVAK